MHRVKSPNGLAKAKVRSADRRSAQQTSNVADEFGPSQLEIRQVAAAEFEQRET